ncbi:MAG: response regulator [Desulfobacteraceae bacterium]|jgi:PAS domain S-box-containing protein
MLNGKPVILVVDDTPQNIELLEAHLVPQGYDIVKAASGEEALEILSGNQIDLILLDAMMPNMSGFDVLEKLRSDKKTQLIPVVMITVLNQTDDRIKAIEAGCDDFISKPFDKHELLVRVKSLLKIKSLHDEVNEAREYAENIINTVREPLIALDQDLRVVTASRSFYDVFRVNPEETVGQRIYDLGNKQWDIPGLRELLETILPQKTTFDNYEVEHDFATIGRRIMLLNARQIKRARGKESILLLAIEDITERKQLEVLLTESEERYRRIFETSSDGIVLLEKCEGKIIQTNQAAEKMLGYSEEECIGKKLQDIGISIDMSDFSTIMRDLDKYAIINYDDVLVKTKARKLIYTDIYMVDRAKLAQCNIRNITERKNLEEQLRQAQKMESVGQLAAGIAHDFNNILMAIVGYGYLLQTNIKSDDPQRINIDQILISADKAAEITHSLLAFSKKQILSIKPINIHIMIKGFLKFLSRLLGEDIELNTSFTDKDVISMADAGQIEQVLLNMAMNARDAMPHGGHLTLDTQLVELDDAFIRFHGYGEPGMFVVISVSDTGSGMEKETMDKIFDPFFSTKDVNKGTGLGLSMAYGIIKQHNGYITVYSEPEKGTTFRIYIPAIRLTKELIVKTVIEARPERSRGDETILVAEDDSALRKLFSTVLQTYGYKVILAENGEEAIKKFIDFKDKIQLVMLDMIMPKKNGKEAYDEIIKLRPDMKILFSSGYSADRIDRNINETFDFVMKPVSPKDLLRKIRGILDK